MDEERLQLLGVTIPWHFFVQCNPVGTAGRKTDKGSRLRNRHVCGTPDTGCKLLQINKVLSLNVQCRMNAVSYCKLTVHDFSYNENQAINTDATSSAHVSIIAYSFLDSSYHCQSDGCGSVDSEVHLLFSEGG